MTSPRNAFAPKTFAFAALAAALAVAVPVTADAMDARGRYTVYGSGELDCGSWTREQKLASSLALKDQAWVLGYITAYNRWVSEERTVLGHLLWVAGELARKEGFEEDGYRVVINNGESAGQTVFHLHVHLMAGRDFAWPPG